MSGNYFEHIGSRLMSDVVGFQLNTKDLGFAEYLSFAQNIAHVVVSSIN